MDVNLKGMLKIFERMFGQGYLENSIFLFTRWSFDKRSEQKRNTGKAKTIP